MATKKPVLDDFEIQMVTLYAKGFTAHDIAAKFPKGINTSILSARKQKVTFRYVENRTLLLRDRLKAKNKTHLVAMLMHKGIITPFK